MSKTSIKTLNTRMLLHRTKLSKKDSKSKPFGFCCSLDRFDPLSRYNQRRPPYESSLMAITSVHECPVSKMQVKFLKSRLTREKRRLKGSEMGNQQRLKNRNLNYSRFDKSDRSIKWYLEDEIAMAKDMFWTEKQRIHNEVSIKAVSIGKKKFKEKQKTSFSLCPRWYQDFSLDQMRNLMNLENVMRTDYEETKTDGTQRILIAIGVFSTFFKLKPNIITELHKSCNLNSVDFLREIYKILTGNDFYREEYKKFYDCNERIILSAIAFLTLPEVLKELHKRLPAMIIPKLPSKPKPPVCLARRKNRCPYKEELFKCSDWASYRNALQKWQKQYKLLQTIPKITLPCFKQQKFLVNDGLLSEIRKEKDIYFNHFEKSDTKDLQKGFSTKFDTKDIVNSKEVTYEDKDSPKQENLKTDKSASNIYQVLDDCKKSNSTISNSKLGTVEHKIYYDAPKLPVNQKSWLDEKKAYYIRDASLQNEIVTEIIGVSNITPSNSDEKFFAMLKLDDRPNKIFPSGRENLSRNWQDWLQNVDEDFKQVEEKADELIKRTQTILKLVFPGLVCDNCCSCRQTRKFEELQQSKASIDNTMQNSEYVAESISMHSLDSTTKLPINLTGSQKEIETNFIISDVTEENGKKLYNKSGVQENISIPDPSVLQLKNVPPCSCAIQQMISKKVSPSLSKDDIPWTKDEGLCMGKKYRPDEARTYFCKKYPTDKSCRRNPFMKEIIRMERDKREEKIKEEEKGNAELIEVVEKEIQTSTKNMLEKKKNKFISDYFVYDNPWNMLHTAPSNITKTNYEKTLKLTPPALPMISLSEKSDVTATREDEHKKDIKYCIKSVATDISMSSPELIIDGMVMLTPFQTLKLSKKGIPQVVAPHRHWSPINIPLDPLQRRKEEMEHRKKASDKAFRFIYENNSEQDASYLNFSYQESDKEKLMTSYETKENDMDMEKKTSKRTAELQSPSKKHTDRKYMAIIKTELKKMAAEGYIFANLPKCYLMPQLRNWIMYRQSVTFSETDKKNLMQTTINTWQLLEMMKTPKLEQPSLSMTKRQLKRLTYNQAKEIKKKIQEARAIFHSKVRKARVSYAHNMWNTMEFGKFPSTSFKRTFFTYMASKEADGHVYKPWLPSEVYGAEPKFSYY